MFCAKRDNLQFHVSLVNHLEIHGCTGWWWMVYLLPSSRMSKILKLGEEWIGKRLISVISPSGNMRVKRRYDKMLVEEYHNTKWIRLRSFDYWDFVEVYHKFKLRDGQSKLFYLQEA